MYLPIEPSLIYVVVPVYNEGPMLQRVMQELLRKNYRLVIVDDGSYLPVADLLNALPAYVLRHKVNLGQGAALQTGLEFAVSKSAKVIVTFDGDGQHKTDDIDSLVTILLTQQLDVVMGSRFMGGSDVPVKRRLLLQIARYINYLFTGLLLTDAHNGIRAFTAEAAKKITITENRMAHATELLWLIKKRKLRYKEAPVTIIYTPYAIQKGQKLRDAFRIFLDLFLNKLFK